MADQKQETKTVPPATKPKEVLIPAPVTAPVAADPVPTMKEQVAIALALMLRSDSYKERSAIANHILDLIPE